MNYKVFSFTAFMLIIYIVIAVLTVYCTQPVKIGLVDKVVLIPVVPSSPAPTPSTPIKPWNVHFSPHGGCTHTVIDFIGTATSMIRVQAYGFTSQSIADALVAAAKSGKDVEVVLDRSDKTAASSKAVYVSENGVKVFIDSKHAIAHSKVMIVDHSSVETGSFNYTDNAENNNAENCLIINDAELTSAYGSNWELHKSHSIVFTTP